MPGIMIERPKMTRTMYQALKRHIMKEREKKKQEQEQDEELARQKKERELKKKKEEEDSLTLEQTREQILQLEKKLEKLKLDKHEFFSQLKKVLHQEDESRKRAQMKENEMVQSIQQQYQHPLFLQGHGHIAQSKYMNVPVHRSNYGSNKRPRSPSPPPVASVYGAYPAPNKYQVTAYSTAVKPERYPNQKSVTYTTPSSHVTYVTQSSHTFPASQHGAAAAAAAAGIYQTAPLPTPGQQPAPGKYPPGPGQSAFTSYTTHYAHQQQQQQLKEQQQQPPQHYPPGAVPPGYRVQLPQQGRAFLPTGHGNSIPLQQQLQHADKKSGFAEEKFKSGAVRSMAQHISGQPGLVSQPPPGLVSQQPVMVTQQPPKGGITTGFPVRTQVSSSSYQPPSQAVSSSTQHPYANTRYYR